jgi:hypothetical protein
VLHPAVVLMAIAVVCVLAMLPTFFANVYYVFVTPSFSVKKVSQDDTFLHALTLVILGGILAAIVIVTALPQIKGTVEPVVREKVQMATASSTSNYRKTAQDVGIAQAVARVDDLITNNYFLVPVICVLCWLIWPFPLWVFSRMFASHVPLSVLYKSLAYLAFAQGLLYYFLLHGALSVVKGEPSLMTALGAVAAIILVFYFFIIVSQALEINVTGAVVITVFNLVVWGGIGALVYFYAISPAYTSFIQNIVNWDPSKSTL